MTGPEHYREAEEMLISARNARSDADPADVSLVLQHAQVHATLALAAATAFAAPIPYEGGSVEWRDAVLRSTAGAVPAAS